LEKSTEFRAVWSFTPALTSPLKRGHFGQGRASPISIYFAYRFINRDRALPYTISTNLLVFLPLLFEAGKILLLGAAAAKMQLH